MNEDYQGSWRSSAIVQNVAAASASSQRRPATSESHKRPRTAPIRRLARQASMNGDINHQPPAQTPYRSTLAINELYHAAQHHNYQLHRQQKHLYQPGRPMQQPPQVGPTSSLAQQMAGDSSVSSTSSASSAAPSPDFGCQSAAGFIPPTPACAPGQAASSSTGSYQQLLNSSHHYSSSQAQLQSLTQTTQNNSTIAFISGHNFGSSGETLHKTTPKLQHQTPSIRTGQLQQGNTNTNNNNNNGSMAGVVGQTSSGNSNNITKPMTSMLNEPGSSILASRQPQLRRPYLGPPAAASMQQQQQQQPPPYTSTSLDGQADVISQQPVSSFQPQQIGSQQHYSSTVFAHQHPHSSIGLHHHQHHQYQQHHPVTLDGLAAAAQLHSQATSGGSLSKSKSCLTCADISIKWYIVVIALLGLICALIGTIVGAVHSAGRDYISLALLLIGVGLVLVAISWIALRITIKTYKTSTQSRNSPRRPGQSGRQQQSLTDRLFGAANQTTASSTLHRSLLNERLYMMAAAAATAAALQSRAAQTGGAQPVPSQRPACEEQPASASQRLIDSIKQRLPRRLARLMPYSSLAESAPSNDSGQPAGRSSRPSEPVVPHPASTLAAATALLQQYQSLLPAGHHHATLLFPPPHLFGFGMGAPGADLGNIRPPPPSYSASMQDYRMRMLLQERAGLQQMNVAAGSANGAQPVARQQAPSSPPPQTSPVNQERPVSAQDEQPVEPAQVDRSLKTSSSTPALSSLVSTNNDIYVSSSSGVNDNRTTGQLSTSSFSSGESPASSSSHNNATIVNIGQSSTTVLHNGSSPSMPATSGRDEQQQQQQRRQQRQRRQERSKSGELKILGYL